MGPSAYYIISAVMMVAFLGVSWFVTSLLHLSGNVETLVRVLLMGVVMTVFGLFYTIRAKRERARAEAAAGGAPAGIATADKEIDVFIRDAETRLAQSNVAQETKLAQLPVFFLIGETGSAKTS